MFNFGDLALALDNTNKMDLNYPVLYAAYLMKFSKHLYDKLQENEKLTGFCKVPESVVRINVGSAKPVNKRQYRIAYHLQKTVDDQILSWKETDIVEETKLHSAWNNPLLVVPKKDEQGNTKGWRVCIDPRPLNLLIPEINYPLPLIKDIFEAFRGSRVFTRIDLKGGFHQFKLHEEDREYTTFTWRGKQYQFVGAPFGFKHLPAMFQKVLTSLFVELDYVLVYIDDIIIFSANFQDHVGTHKKC